MSHCWKRWRNSMVWMDEAFHTPYATCGLGWMMPRPPPTVTLLGGPEYSGGKLNTGENRNESDRSIPTRPLRGTSVAPARYCASVMYFQFSDSDEPSSNVQPRAMLKPAL